MLEHLSGSWGIIGTLVLGFVVQTFFLKGNFSARLEDVEKEVTTLRKTVVYTDVCKAKHGSHQ